MIRPTDLPPLFVTWLVAAPLAWGAADVVLFQSTSTIGATGSSVRFVDAGDLDGDGDLDVVFSADPPETLLTWHENTAGDASTWTVHTIPTVATETSEVQVADLDGDGDNDLVVVEGSPFLPSVVWYENTVGDASAWTSHTVGSGSLGFAADFDGDLDLDLAVLESCAGSSCLYWEENTAGDGSTWTRRLIRNFGLRTLFEPVPADVDEDGDEDIIYATTNATVERVLGWLENDGSGLSWTDRVIDSGPDDADPLGVPFSTKCWDDVDGDGDSDLLATGIGVKGRVYRNDGGGTLTFVANFGTSDRGEVADVDRDGDLDIVIDFPSFTTKLFWLENQDGIGTSWGSHEIAQYNSTKRFQVADLDGDDHPDLLLNSLEWLENLSEAGTSITVPGTGGNPVTFVEVTTAGTGSTWQTTIDIATPGALASVVIVGFGGSLSPGLLLGGIFGGELLCLPPFYRPFDVAFGTHTIVIPDDPILCGYTFCAQGATFVPGSMQFTNALEVTIGSY